MTPSTRRTSATGHISTLHIWPARRPLAACRAALIATLLPDPGNAGERDAIYERMAGKVVETVQDERVDGRSVTRRKRETQGGILHWKREEGDKGERAPDIDWFRSRIREAYGGRAPEGARSVRRRRRDTTGGDASGVRRDRSRYQSGRMVHPQVHARLPEEALG